MHDEDSSINTALRNFMLDILAELHTCMPGQIEQYNSTTQKAEVKPLLKRAMKDGTQLAYPIISDVPVCFPSGNDASITFPLSKGTIVLLLFSEKSLNNWVVSGNDSDTEQGRLHSLSDCIALPGIIPFNAVGKTTDSTAVEVSLKDQKIVIKADGSIELGIGDILNPLQKVVTEAFVTAFNSHTHICAASGSPSSTPGTSVPPITMGNTHLTSKVQAV
jgi:hypothetical protein